MQIREKTAQEWAAEEHIHLFTHFQMLDPVKNARAGAWYLRKLLRRYPRTDDPLPYALADYNAGRARVLQWSNNGAAATNSAAFLARMDYPGTRRYVQSVMKRYQHYRPIFPPKNKRLASNIFLPLSEHKRRFSSNPDPRSSVSQMKQVLQSLKPLAFPFIRPAFLRIQSARPKSTSSRASFAPTACPQAGASAEPPTEAKPAHAPDFPRRTSRAGRGLHTAPIPDPTAARFDVAEVARSGGLDACIPAQRRGKFDNSLCLNDPPNIDPPNIDRNLQSALEVPRYQHLATTI
jgi:hypothetical protein